MQFFFGHVCNHSINGDKSGRMTHGCEYLALGNGSPAADMLPGAVVESENFWKLAGKKDIGNIYLARLAVRDGGIPQAPLDGPLIYLFPGKIAEPGRLFLQINISPLKIAITIKGIPRLFPINTSSLKGSSI